MIKVDLRHYIENATPAEVFLALSDPDGLMDLLPRLRKAEMTNIQTNQAHLVMHIWIGQIVDMVHCEGKLTWVEEREISFVVQKPLPVKVHWALAPGVLGTDIRLTLTLDLAPLLGPIAFLVPNEVVKTLIVRELEHALLQIPKRLKKVSLQEQAFAA
jgi:carbon monoxide dehydrogenase subunit G